MDTEVDLMTEYAVESSPKAVVDLNEKKLIRVLHVDDEPSLLKIAKQCLEMEGQFQVDTAASVEEAMERMKSKSYDAIVSDYQMPGKDGLELLKELREEGNTTPFIVFTGKGREEVAIKALNLGAAQYLNKSGNPETVYGELVHAIRQAAERKSAQERIEESEERYRNLFELAPDAIALVDLKGIIVECNEASADLYGYSSKEELIGKNALDFAAKKDYQRALENMTKTLEQGQTRNLVYTLVTRQGRETEVEVAADTVRDASGIPVGFVAVVRDITERKRSEEKIRESREKFERLFMDNPEAAAYVDPDFHILDVNPSFEELFGYSLSEVKGKYINDTIVPKDRMEEAEMLNRRIRKEQVYYDTARKRKNGSLVSVSMSAAPIRVEGRLIGYMELYKDITVRNEVENELEESRRHFQTLFNLMVDPVAIVDGRGKILEITQRAEEITGFKREELVGKNFLKTEILSARSKVIMIKNLAKRMMGLRLAPYEIEVLTKDGRKLPHEINAARIEYNGKPADLVVFRDVSERKKMEEKLRVVGSLTRHDVRNKLSTITGNAYLLKRQLAGNREVLDKLGDMETAVQQITKIFDFARAYELLGVEELVYIDVEKTVDEAVGLFSDLKGIKVTISCHGLTILADSMLRQMFYNLMDNSLKYGQKTTRIGVYYEEAGQDALKLIYEDDGVGIPIAEKPRLFKEGYSTGGSTGHGLYLAKKMMEVYGWTIQETGEPGKGTRFIITIPKINQNGKENYLPARKR
jgi:PAS domain S-box-containing protein